MSGNRVEELEANVRKLQATVDGLTDELVETKERLRAVEDETGVEPEIIEGRAARRDRDEPIESSADGGVTTDGEAAAESDGEESADSGPGDDIIVA